MKHGAVLNVEVDRCRTAIIDGYVWNKNIGKNDKLRPRFCRKGSEKETRNEERRQLKESLRTLLLWDVPFTSIGVREVKTRFGFSYNVHVA